MRVLVAALAACLATGCSDDAPLGPYEGHDSEIYRDPSKWLCHPDQADEDNLCVTDLDTSVVAADGSVTIETHQAAAEPAVDCFYVYPTVSADQTEHADFEVGEDEPFIVVNQAARLSSVCRVYAPIYRQLTVATVLATDDIASLDWASAYADVVDAFKHYIANHNDGRGVVLVGHSQGSRHLLQLLQEEVETTPALAERLISAYLIGGTVEVPSGQDVGGSLVSTPLCRSSDQTGCVVTYASYRATEPPESATSIFGETATDDTVAGCVSPAALTGGGADISSYFPIEVDGLFGAFVGRVGPFADPTQHDLITTPFYSLPGLLRGECVDRDGHQYFEVTVMADPEDPRADDIDGDLAPGWGLHLVDVHLMMGDLVTLAQNQVEAWLSK